MAARCYPYLFFFFLGNRNSAIKEQFASRKDRSHKINSLFDSMTVSAGKEDGTS